MFQGDDFHIVVQPPPPPPQLDATADLVGAGAGLAGAAGASHGNGAPFEPAAANRSLPLDPGAAKRFEQLRSNRDDSAPRQPVRKAESERVGRNDPCPCGSGKKFKKCHGA